MAKRSDDQASVVPTPDAETASAGGTEDRPAAAAAPGSPTPVARDDDAPDPQRPPLPQRQPHSSWPPDSTPPSTGIVPADPPGTAAPADQPTSPAAPSGSPGVASRLARGRRPLSRPRPPLGATAARTSASSRQNDAAEPPELVGGAALSGSDELVGGAALSSALVRQESPAPLALSHSAGRQDPAGAGLRLMRGWPSGSRFAALDGSPLVTPNRRPWPTIPHPRGRGLVPPPARPSMPFPVPATRPDAEPDASSAAAAGTSIGPRRLGLAVGVVILLTAGVWWSNHDRGDAYARRSVPPLPAASAVDSPAPVVPLPVTATPSTSGTPRAEPTSKATTPASPARTPASVPASDPPPPAPQGLPNPFGVDLALNQPARASSFQGFPWSPSHAVDGHGSTRWSSGFSDPQWIAVDLGSLRQLTLIRLSWEHAYATAYRVQVSSDARTWKTVYRTDQGRGGLVAVKTGDISARYVRIYCTERNSVYGYSLLELDVR